MQITNISDAKSSLSALIAQVEKGKKVIIGKAGKPVAMLVPYKPDTSPRKLGGTWQGKIRIAADFDALPAELAEAFHAKPAP